MNRENSDIKRTTIFIYLLFGIGWYTENSMKFCISFSKNGGLKYWLKLLKDKNFVMKNQDAEVQNINPINVMITTIYNLSRSFEEDTKLWVDLDTINVLLKMSEVKETFRNNAYSSIINIADDKQLETLPEMKSVKLFIVDRLDNIAKDFEWDKLVREPIQMSIKGKIVKCQNHLYYESVQNLLFNTILQFKLLYKLSINKKIGTELYFENNLMKHLKTILLNGNYFEIYFILEIVAQLTFDEKIALHLKEDIPFRELVEKLNKQDVNEITSKDEKKAYYGVKTFIEQINWNFNKKVIKTDKADTAKHIMISNNKASRPLCLDIKKNLKAFGHHVWIDVSDIYGSSLDAMAKAVEDASCVLMCVTEKYRQSVYCQAEAQYAFKLKKIIIPVIMQSAYEPQGWLGMIMGVKMHVIC